MVGSWKNGAEYKNGRDLYSVVHLSVQDLERRAEPNLASRSTLLVIRAVDPLFAALIDTYLGHFVDRSFISGGDRIEAVRVSGILENMDVLMESSWTGSARFERAPSLSPKFVLDLPADLVRELTDSFEFFDRNGDGRISQDELGAVMRSLGQRVSDADLARLICDVDANGDGFIDLYEFIELNTRPIAESCSESDSEAGGGVDSASDVEAAVHEALRSAFGVFDADNNGLISAEELQRVLVAVGDEVSLEECRRMIQCVDQDGDHMVDFREFEILMSSACVH